MSEMNEIRFLTKEFSYFIISRLEDFAVKLRKIKPQREQIDWLSRCAVNQIFQWFAGFVIHIIAVYCTYYVNSK